MHNFAVLWHNFHKYELIGEHNYIKHVRQHKGDCKFECV